MKRLWLALPLAMVMLTGSIVTFSPIHDVKAAETDIPVTSSTTDVGASTEELTCFFKQVTISGTAGDDIIYGTYGDDVIAGLAGNDVIYGLGGNDRICGWGGNDIIYAGKGDDLVKDVKGNDIMYGEDGSDTLNGGDGDDKLYGGAGIDKLTGDAGNDQLYGNSDNDILSGNDGMDRLYGGPNDDILNGDNESDTLNGEDGNDVLNGGDGDDRLYGGPGDDRLTGDAGNDQLYGYTGTDSCFQGETISGCEQTSPNVVLILADDQRYDMVTKDIMPNTWQLAQEGANFTNYFVTTGLCCPSRASILTGQYVHNHDVWSNENPTGGATKFNPNSTIATWLDGSGYNTALIGKYLNQYWLIAPKPPVGWDRWLAFYGAMYYNYTYSDNGTEKIAGNTTADYSTDFFAGKAVEFIKTAQRPFFLYFAPNAPHRGVSKLPSVNGLPEPAPRHMSTCDSIPNARPPSWNETDMSDKPQFLRGPLINSTAAAAIDNERRLAICSLKALDEAVKAVVDQLRATNELDNTVLIFTSDNGYLYGEHRMLGKTQLYDESVRDPLIIRYPPLIHQPTLRTELVANIDLAPTIAELTGTQIPPTHLINGKSIVGIFNGSSWRTDLLFEQHRNGNESAIRTLQYKYIEHVFLNDVKKEFYDLSIDPYELDNYIGRTEYIDTIAELQERLQVLKASYPPEL